MNETESEGEGERANLFPLREIPTAPGIIGYVNVPINTSDVRAFKKEMGKLMDDPLGVSERLDEFLGTSIYSYEDLTAILRSLFNTEEREMIRQAGIREWERRNPQSTPGDQKWPSQDPRWNAQTEEGRRSMIDMRNIIIQGIREAVPRGQNLSKVFGECQGKDETPTEWLERLRKSLQIYSGTDPDSPVGEAIVAVALLVEEAKKITFGAPITVYTPHNVRTILQQKAEKWLTDARLLKYEAILLHAPELELKTTQASNPAGFLFGEASSEPIHNCIDLVELQTKIREDLEDEELEEGEKWFVDGSARVIEGKRKSGYAIIDGKTGEVIKSGPLGTSWSAQACELYAVLQALKGLKGKIGTIFTDSKYAFGVVHTFGKIWEERGLVNTRGKGLIHEDLIRQILKAVREPKAIAVVYVKSHQAGLQFRIRGNNLADQEARKAALLTLDTPESRTENFGEVSPHPTEKEIEDFKKMGGNLINGKWKLTDGRELIPKAYARIILKRLHAQTHWGTQALAEQFLKFFGCKGIFELAKQEVQSCLDEEGLDPENKIQKVALEFKRQELAAKKKRMEQERMRTLSEQYEQLEKQSNDWSLATSSKNLFLDLVQEIATELGLTNCWICGGLKSAERWPWKGESLTPEQLLKWDNKILNTLTRPGGWTLDERVIGTICISREGNVYSDVVGYTPCLSTLAVNSNNRSKMWQPEPPNGYWGKEKQGKCNWVEEIELCWHELTNANPYYSLTELVEFWDKPENIDIKWKAPSGIYWICGKEHTVNCPGNGKGPVP
ncbi:hypothetical protein DUI87_20804 [Hirundo rustica rustica]|uniref:RNase H type-1 domain-containing protein n=1 Tax=Hirundo rustica rustica TaxID=333673 RepID=A0A3M0JP72_HIRRU|nr:hypothetical protein DUI87_20804 [Hirundo rustica rustica]